MTKSSKYIIILLSYIAFLVLTYFTKGGGYSDWMFLTITFVVFIFAIFLAFSISNRRDRIVALRESLREMDGTNISMHNYSKAFGDEYSKKLLHLIDEYLILQIDYRLSDFKKTQDSYMKIYDFVATTKAKNDVEEDAKMAMMDDLENAMKLREKVEFRLSDQMQPYEWITIIALSLLTIFTAAYINDGTWVSLAVLPIVEAVIIVIFITISDLDSLRWQEKNWIWEPMSALFIALGLSPYFPDVLIIKKRVSKSFLQNYQSYRLGHYQFPYPDLTDKTIEIVKNNQ